VTRSAPEVQGRVARGFEAVAEEFGRTLETGSGAAFAALVDGEPAVDVWGGLADRDSGAPWREDTVQIVFSGTKGFVAVCLLVLIDRGVLDLAAPVARYWPEFAAAGKEDVLVRHVVSHVSGLPGLRRGFGPEELLDSRRLAAELALEEPLWEPGTQLAYHAFTYGWLCDELVRRVDGRSVARFFADEVAVPLGLELWIGLPQAHENRVARVQRAEGYGITFLGEEPEPLLEALYGDLLSGRFPWNDAAFQRAEIPAGNAIGTVRSIARLYACLAGGGELDGLRILSSDAVQLGRSELARGVCAVTRRPYAFGVGFELQTELRALGPPAAAFGHTGSGGSVHGAWPDELVGVSYAPNELRAESGDTRARRILAALAMAIGPGRRAHGLRARSSVVQKSSPVSM
jgi:CubicO group peptidase (beta-lactamase class C family)